MQYHHPTMSAITDVLQERPCMRSGALHLNYSRNCGPTTLELQVSVTDPGIF